MSNPQYVYTMSRLSKAWPGGKCLKISHFPFCPGQKSGYLVLMVLVNRPCFASWQVLKQNIRVMHGRQMG